MTFYRYDHSTYLSAMLVNRRNRKHRSSVHFRKYYDIEEMRTHDTQLSPNIPLPSWKFLHLVIILECITSVLWMQIFGTILTTTAHNLKTKRLKAYGIAFACFVITIKHDFDFRILFI